MPEVTVDDVLVRWRERMADPAMVVIDRANLWEDAGGSECDETHAVRGCLLGNSFLAFAEVKAAEGARFEADQAVRDYLPQEFGRGLAHFFETRGREASVTVLDRVIADRRREAAGV